MGGGGSKQNKNKAVSPINENVKSTENNAIQEAIYGPNKNQQTTTKNSQRGNQGIKTTQMISNLEQLQEPIYNASNQTQQQPNAQRNQLNVPNGQRSPQNEYDPWQNGNQQQQQHQSNVITQDNDFSETDIVIAIQESMMQQQQESEEDRLLKEVLIMSKLEQDKQMGKINLSHLKRKKPDESNSNQPTQRSNIIQVKSKFDPPMPQSLEKKPKKPMTTAISLAPVILNKQAVIPPIQSDSNSKQPQDAEWVVNDLSKQKPKQFEGKSSQIDSTFTGHQNSALTMQTNNDIMFSPKSKQPQHDDFDKLLNTIEKDVQKQNLESSRNQDANKQATQVTIAKSDKPEEDVNVWDDIL